MSKKYFLGFIIITIVIFVFGLNTGENDDNTLTIYTAIEEEYVNEYLADFKEKNPDIKLNVIRDSSGVVSAKLMLEKDNPRADVAWGIPASSVLLLEKYDLFAPYESQYLANLDNKFYDTTNEVPTWAGISAWMTAFTVNIDELNKKGLNTPTSYEDLLDSRYSSSIIMPNPASSGTGFLTVSAWLQIMGEEKGWEFMDKLNSNIKEYSHSGSAPTKQAAKGEAILGIGMDFMSFQMESKNDKIITILPQEGSGWELEVISLVKKDNIKPAAKKFYDWALSPEVMAMYAKYRSLVTEIGYLPESAEKYPIGVNEQMIENNLIWASENRTRILREWEQRYGVGE
ncbi:MAG: putative 2-aminoethylphosphonate ABC transporter substrate-binding protein [Clostridium sp.]